MPISRLPGLTLSSTTMSILEAADAAGQLTLFNSVDELVAAAAPPEECSEDGFYTTWIKAPLEGGQWSISLLGGQWSISLFYTLSYRPK